ncbi:MAG: helix-turn-helix domain-containing protein [Methanosarcinaceae archaeon]|nr:helix-turn-helix domain-containing protein [Methanosarcinaceae archaeon]
MRKGESFQRISISPAEYKQLEIAEPKTKSVKILKRIQAFKLIYLGCKYSDIAGFLSVTNNTITNWINYYKEGGIDSLLVLNYKGGQAKLNDDQLSELRIEASKGVFAFAKDVQHYISKNFGIEYNISHVQRLCKKNFNYPFKKQD